RTSVFVRNTAIGIFVSGSDATLDGIAVRDTQPRVADAEYGRGMMIQLDVPTMQRSTVEIRSSVFERNQDEAVMCAASDLTALASVFSATQPRSSDGTYGDGIAIAGKRQQATATVLGSSIDGNARAGISSFGATAIVGGTRLECNRLHLDGEVLDDQ